MKDKLNLSLILLLLGYVLFLEHCKRPGVINRDYLPKVDTIIQIDTIMPPPVVIKLSPKPVPPPVIVYVDSSKNIVATSEIDSTKHQVAKLYKDSLEDENLTLYYDAVVHGELLQSKFDYKLKVPKQITKTLTINKPYVVPTHQVFLTGSVGTDFQGMFSTQVGLEYVSPKGWKVGYSYDIARNSHSVEVGVRLFRYVR